MDTDQAQRIEALYVRYAADIQRYVYHLTHDPFQAEDIMQTTFLKACQNAHTIQDAHAYNWLRLVARNTVYDIYRHRHACQVRNITDGDAWIADPETQEDRITNLDIRARIDALDTLKQRRVMQLLADGFDYADIAAEMKMSRDGVKMMVMRMRPKLRA